LFSEKIKQNQPFASKFFEAALAENAEKLSQAYLLFGGDTLAQYNLALQTAKILNCKTKTPDCNCTNCNWIKQNRHPAVITISPIDYLYGNKDGKPKSEISIEQARYLKQQLMTASPYHRVIIFTNAAEGEEYASVYNKIWADYLTEISPPKNNSEDETRENWIPLPLTSDIFNTSSANALLKTIEEPPSSLTFFFLTKDREDVIETIVSRTQVIHVQTNFLAKTDLQLLSKFFEAFPPKNTEEVLGFSERLLQLAKENSISEHELLIIMQNYFYETLKTNSADKNISRNLIKKIEAVEKALKEINGHVNIQSVFDNLLFELKN